MTSNQPASGPLPRRRFLQQSTALVASGLAVGFHWSGAVAKGTHGSPSEEFEPNAWVRVLPDDTIKIVVHKHDSGTGTHTALAACVAEELDVDPFAIEVINPEHPFYKAYIHPIWKVFSTGGSTSVSLEYDRLRQAGATARAMLIQAAAQRWNVRPQSCRTENGVVRHPATERRANYGELADEAAQLPVPEHVALKDPAEFKYIGKLQRKRDARAKVTGTFQYSIDVKVPNMWVAVITRAPVIGSRVAHLDATEALKMPGVHQVVVIPERPDILGANVEGVAVLADNYWAAARARSAVKVKWTDSDLADFDSDKLADIQAAWLADPAAKVVTTIGKGDAEEQWSSATHVVEASYDMPYKAANPMEPMCVTAWEHDGGVTFWGGIQVPSFALEAAQNICQAPEDKVVLNNTISGGSFGAREGKYWLYEAVHLTHVTGRPVKLLNAREDEIQALYGHAAAYLQLKGAVDDQGTMTALKLRAVAPASPEQWEPGYDDRPDHMDYSTTESITQWDFAYTGTEHLDVGWVRHETGVPTAWYRSVSFIPNVFAVESFMDELAHAAGRDALAFRLQHMQDRPRHVNVLKEACRRAGWGTSQPEGRALGLATNQAYDSYQAVVAEVYKKDDSIAVRKLTCVIDCGLAVSPSGVREQVYGGLMWGMGHAMKDKLDIRHGSVVQSNFHDYPVIRMPEMPEVDIVILEGDHSKPSGVGELTNTAVSPAIANAIFNLTGERQRRTPLRFTMDA